MAMSSSFHRNRTGYKTAAKGLEVRKSDSSRCPLWIFWGCPRRLCASASAADFTLSPLRFFNGNVNHMDTSDSQPDAIAQIAALLVEHAEDALHTPPPTPR